MDILLTILQICVCFNALHLQISMVILYLKDVFTFALRALTLKTILGYANLPAPSDNTLIIWQGDV